MKLYDVVLIVSSTMLGLQVCAQTNFQDNTSHSSGTNESQVILVTNWVAPSSYIRVVNGTVCDVTTSPQWVWITIPYGSSVELPKRFQFNGSVQLMTVTFRIISQTAGSTSMDYVTITNYPYDPRKFASDGRYGGIKTKETLRLCLFPTQSPQPYWDALGNMKVSRVRDFEYVTGFTFLVQSMS